MLKPVLFIFTALCLVCASYARNIEWSGYTWTVAGGSNKAPGPNNWAHRNVWVDSDGALNLRIDSTGSAGIMSKKKFGFGTYIWLVEGDLCITA